MFDEQDDEFENIDVLHMQRTDKSLTATPSKSEGMEKAGTLRMIVYVIDEAGNYVIDADGNWRFEPDGSLEADNPNAEEVDVTGNSVTYWVD